MRKLIPHFVVVALGLCVGIGIHIQPEISKQLEVIDLSDLQITNIMQSNPGARCDNMFQQGDNCKSSTAGCGPGEGGTGYNLSCTISCDNGAEISCGSSELGEASLRKDEKAEPCTVLG
jgi:hypothetical protein